MYPQRPFWKSVPHEEPSPPHRPWNFLPGLLRPTAYSPTHAPAVYDESQVFETTKERDAQIVRAILLLLCRQARATGAASESTKSAHNASIPRASAAATTPPDKCPGFPCSPGPSGSSRSPKKGSIERYETASDWRGIKRNLARSRPTEESKYSTL